MSLDIFKKSYGRGSPPARAFCLSYRTLIQLTAAAEIVLLPVWEIQSWADAHLKKYDFHHFGNARQKPDGGLTDVFRRATAKYDLVDPSPADADWARYMEYHKDTEEHTSFLMHHFFDGAEVDEYVTHLRETVDDVIGCIADDADELEEKLRDIVSITRYENQVDDNNEVSAILIGQRALSEPISRFATWTSSRASTLPAPSARSTSASNTTTVTNRPTLQGFRNFRHLWRTFGPHL
jgi:hypothetical protein